MDWISVKDFLPPRRMWVLVTTFGGEYNTDLCTWFALYRNGKFYDVLDSPTFEKEMLDIEWWMKLPEPKGNV